jgi:hypothetical protein
VTFDEATWSAARRLRIAGVDDMLSDGEMSYAITLTATSDDPDYGALAPVAVSLTNRDDEGPADPLDPIAHWRFDETTGTTVADSSGNGYHGTVTGGTWMDSALMLDGNGSCVTFSDAFDPGARSATVAGWVKGGTNNTAVRRVVTDGNLFQGYQGFALSFSGDGNYLSVEAGGWKYVRQARNAAGANNGAWHHFAMVLDRAQHRILGYLNGSNSGWTSAGFSNQLESYDRIFSFEPLRIGCAPNGAYNFIGGVDDFRYYRRALPPAEIQALFAAGR